MIIFPAIDIQDGQCVRLTQGDFSTVEQVADDAVETARAFEEAGAKWLHMVDLDGAKTATQPNKSLFLAVAKSTNLRIQLGGGIRDEATAAFYLENGIERVILGSAAAKNPRLVADLVREYGDRIVVGIDAKGGIVQTEGWQLPGKTTFLSMAKLMQEVGVRHIVYTDISKDGTLEGPNMADLRRLKGSLKMNIIASGGIKDIANIQALKKLQVYGVICGKSLYKGTLDLKEAIKAGYDPKDDKELLQIEERENSPPAEKSEDEI